MADLTLKINGDSSGAATALRETGAAAEGMGEDVGKSVVKWQELANVTKAAVAAVVKFGIDAVKAYADAERVQAQLTRAAGKYAAALGEQAEAMSKVYAVDDDIIKQSQTLLVQWGGVGAATEETTKAILNYAAATGQDAVSATNDLIRNVESGGAGLRKMGVDFKETGDRGKDLTAAVAALNGKFGGAAAANADTLTGSLQLASMAFEDLKKDLGESISKFLSETGAVEGLTQALRNMREFITGNEQERLIKEGLRQGAIINAKKELAYAEEELNAAMMEGQSQTILELFSQDVINAQAKLDKLLGDAKKLNNPADVPVEGRTNKGGKDDEAAAAAARAAAKAQRDAEQKEQEQVAEADAKRNEEWRKQELSAQEEYAKESVEVERERIAERIQALDDERKQIQGNAEIQLKERVEQAEKEAAAIAKAQRDEWEAQQREFSRQEQIWAEAGAAIGAALVTSIAQQLERLASGEDLDPGEALANVIGDVLAVAGQVIGTAVGTAYGGPGGAALGGAVGGAVGGLAGAGVKALGRAGRKARTYHSGGWVGDEAELPRYHSGTWVGGDERAAILQTGERVLSRSEVSRMGGHGGVDAAAKGAPAFTVNVTAVDSQGVRQFFENQGGRGFFNALRTGRGSLIPAFGGG